MPPTIAIAIVRKRSRFARRDRVSRCLQVAAVGAVTLWACASQLRGEPPAANVAPPKMIQQVDLVHFSHTDFGFTDHPVICRELYRRYLDIAIDAALATMNKPSRERFYWTAETTVPVDDWWQTTSAERRAQFLKAVRVGQLEVTALPLNQTATLNGREWETMLHWLPKELWQRVEPKAAIQDDVNGFPRAGALALLDRGVHYLFTGINADSGGPPKNPPAAFWWKMPDGRKLFVWLGFSYPAGVSFFEPQSWRRGPVPMATDTRYRPPRRGDILASDAASVRKAHGHFVERLRSLESQGYHYPTLLISMTNEWRMDNDPPFPPVAEFVGEWNRLGLKPALRLTTLSVAMRHMEEQIGREVPVYEGEWTDWWANGVASGPRELSASRLAKRLAAAAESPLWGSSDDRVRKALDEIYRDLCLFDEHTWGASNSVALPDDLETLGQYNEKARLAYRPVALARLLLSERVRTRLADEAAGLYLANTARAPWSGWVTMPATCLREDSKCVEDSRSRFRTPLEFRNGLRPFTKPAGPQELSHEDRAATFPDHAPGQLVRFWAEGLEGGRVRQLQLRSEAAAPENAATVKPSVTHDYNGWPTGAAWKEMSKPLFLPGIGDITVVRPRGFAPRWQAREIWDTGDAARRAKMRQERLEVIPAAPDGKTITEANAHTTVYTQTLRHARCRWIVRQLELWNREPRARLTLRFDRTTSPDPEVFFAAFCVPCEGALPRLSNGGMPFVPYRDQLPGTCRDYFAIDGWADYATSAGHWLWVSRDAPLVTFGEHNVLAHRTDGVPSNSHRIFAMLLNNLWYTNFVGDSHGVMEFQFDLVWRRNLPDSAAVKDLAETLCSEPQVVINPALKESPIYMERLYRP
jgi:hypothetical protein